MVLNVNLKAHTNKSMLGFEDAPIRLLSEEHEFYWILSGLAGFGMT